MLKILKSWLAYFRNNGLSLRTVRQFSPDLIRQTLRYRYMHWPRGITRYVRGQHVLDIGCGMGLHSIGFVNSGVKSYTGCDPAVNLQSDRIKLNAQAERVPCGWTMEAIMRHFPHVRLVAGLIADLPRGQRFDVIVLHNTTEHLLGA